MKAKSSALISQGYRCPVSNDKCLLRNANTTGIPAFPFTCCWDHFTYTCHLPNLSIPSTPTAAAMQGAAFKELNESPIFSFDIVENMLFLVYTIDIDLLTTP